MSKISSQNCYERWFGGSMWRCMGMNESVWSPGTPRGPPGAFWGPRGPKQFFFWFLGMGGPGGPPVWPPYWPYRGLIGPISPCAGWRVSALYTSLWSCHECVAGSASVQLCVPPCIEGLFARCLTPNFLPCSYETPSYLFIC